MNPQQPDNTAATAALITKAIGYNENGGKPDVNDLKAGKSGEMKSIFQYTPATWKEDAREVLGNANAPLNPANESLVTFNKVHKWLQEDKTPEQIFSIWNAGPGEENAYTGKFSDGQSSVGINKEGIRFNVPSYVKNGMRYYQQFSSEVQGANSQQNAQPLNAQNAPPVIQGAKPNQSIATPISNAITAIQSNINPASTPIAKKTEVPQIIQGERKPKSKMGLIQGMLPQYGQYL